MLNINLVYPFYAASLLIKERDFNDSNRPTAPLKQADDAVLLDTSNLDREGSIAAVIALVILLVISLMHLPKKAK